MSALTRLLPNTIRNFAVTTLSSITQTAENAAFMKPGGLFSVMTRSVIRVHFPRPSETKRIKRHGYKKRMSEPGGRKVLMNRILKGRFVYSH